MVPIIFTATSSLLVGALATYFLLLRRFNSYVGQAVEPRNLIKLVGVQIICGDCAGEDEVPAKTYLTAQDKCARCGGNSYVLASAFESTVMLFNALQIFEAAARENSDNVISIEEHIASRVEKNQKIAV
jgi:hypothetical protein